PYPGTRLYKRLLAEGRLTDPKWWLRGDHDEGSPYYRPVHMTREELKAGWVKAWIDFYTFSSMWRRFVVGPGSSWLQAIGYWPLNFMQNRLAHLKIAGGKQRYRSNVEPASSPFASDGTVPAQVPTPVGFPELQPPRAVRLPLVR